MIDVFYIAYLKSNEKWGLKAFNNFLNSLEQYQAGIEYRLTVLLRGFENNLDEYNKIKEICKAKNINILDTVDVGFDFGAYLDGARSSDADYICCIGTSCTIQCDDWLKKLYSPIILNNKYQYVGSRGAWESCPKYVSDFHSLRREDYSNKLLYYWDQVKNFLRRCFTVAKIIVSDSPAKISPNYAIATSSFLINREIFIEYFANYKLPKTKIEAYKVENGDNSISKFVIQKGYDFCVVNSSGKIFDKEDFDKSGTYRCKDKLYIIKDRQIENYENAPLLLKLYLRKLCWGSYEER